MGGFLVLGKSLVEIYQWFVGSDSKIIFKGETLIIRIDCFRRNMNGSPRRARRRPRPRVEKYFFYKKRVSNQSL